MSRPPNNIGSKRDVWHGYALSTRDGYTRQDLYINTRNSRMKSYKSYEITEKIQVKVNRCKRVIRATYL